MMTRTTKLFIASMMFTFLAVVPTLAQKHHHSHCGHHCDQPRKTKKAGPPSWAPAHGLRTHVAQYRHVYYPDHDIYYDTRDQVYIYFDRGHWTVSARLPLPLRRLHIESSAYVVLDTYMDAPQRHHDRHRRDYAPTRTASYGRRAHY